MAVGDGIEGARIDRDPAAARLTDMAEGGQNEAPMLEHPDPKRQKRLLHELDTIEPL